MSTDRELLELAAKAAGLLVEDYKGSLAIVECEGNECWRTDDYWNPLTDDGDEARLEASLGLDVEWGDSSVVVSRHGIGVCEPYGIDKQAARRRAGVRAAAEIGRSMP